jgi:hypothetical protein
MELFKEDTVLKFAPLKELEDVRITKELELTS